MKYMFNHSKVSALSAELIMIKCEQRSNQGNGNFHRKCRMRCHSNWRKLAISYLWGQDFFLVLRSEYEVLKRKNT